MPSLPRIQPHTSAKHKLLDKYLRAWFSILSRTQGVTKLIVVDGFCGPGRYESGEVGSPIIALKAALTCTPKTFAVEFWFNDQDAEFTSSLESELLPFRKFTNLTVHVKTGDFSDMLADLLVSLRDTNHNIPVFAFIDPFGWKDISIENIQELLRNHRVEVFFNLMTDAINRWLGTHPSTTIQNDFKTLLGNDCQKLISEATDRPSAIRHLFVAELRKVAQFVLPFTMKVKGREHNHLVWAGNHVKGNIRMKEVMYKVADDVAFYFSDDDFSLRMNLDESILSLNAYDIVKHVLESQPKTTVDVLIKVIERSDRFLAKHLKAALKQAEISGEILVSDLRSDGLRRRKGTFSDSVVVSLNNNLEK